MRRRHAVCCVIAATLPMRAQRPARIGYMSARRGPNEFEQAFMRGMLERGTAHALRLRLPRTIMLQATRVIE